MKKQITTALLAAFTGISIAAPFAVCNAQAVEQKTADVYILAGQSNAVGCSNLDQTVYNGTGVYRETLAADDERNTNGYDNILYYGAVNVLTSEDTLPDPDFVSVKMGLGQSSAYSGPELGLAKKLSETASADHPVLIIKYAAGGTFLGDYDGSFSAYNFTQTYGNWASPTTIARWTEEGKKVHKYSGLMYNRLIEFTRQGLGKLKLQGYLPEIKGYFWMQGESDSEDKKLSADYYQNLCDLIGDMRRDVAQLAEDENAANRPFIVGKITPTYNFTHAYGMNTLRANQDQAAADTPYVYTVETDDLPVFDTSVNETCGSDICHFNAADVYTLGKRFAESALAHTAAYGYAVSVNGAGGRADASSYLSDGESVTIGYTADEGYALNKVYLNGADVTDECLSEKIVVITPKADDRQYNTVVLEFTAQQTQTPDTDPDPEEPSDFPAWGIGLICAGVAIVLVGAIAACVVLVKRKKK